MAPPERIHTFRESDFNSESDTKRHRVSGSDGDNSMSQRRQQLLKERCLLPIWSARQDLVQMIKDNRALVVVGETGSGKTTQIPQFLLHGGLAGRYGGIACTQPRRVAAMSVARRVAEEMGTRLGGTVGYSIRFDDMTSQATRIKYMTDGMLLREALIDPLLKKYQECGEMYGVVIVDEAHERTVQTDVLLGLLKGVLDKRGDDFRLVVMSATLDANKFVRYLKASKAAYIQGRTFPISLFYTAVPEENYMDAALNAALQIHMEESEGDILVFLTGQDEIESMERILRDRAGQMPPSRFGGLKLSVVSIYASMPPEQQMKVFEPPSEGYRKIILATNIAETSITIGGVRFVIDPGVVKSRGYNAKLGVDSLEVIPVSQAQARQRSGRAGREAPGKAYRLFTERTFLELEPTTLPEIQRSNLGSVMLQLKAMGIDDVLNFDFLDPPPRAAVIRSLEMLLSLGALDNQGRLSETVGRTMSKLPVEPMFGKILIASAGMGCLLEVMQVVAMVSADNIFVVPREKKELANAARIKFTSRDGDHLTLLNVMRAFLEVPRKEKGQWSSDNFLNVRSLGKANDIFEQLKRHADQLGLPCLSCGTNYDAVRRALVTGLFINSARLQPDGTFKVITSGQQVWLHPSSTLLGKKPPCIIFSELVRTTKAYAREVTAIESTWLPELVPGFFATKPAHVG